MLNCIPCLPPFFRPPFLFPLGDRPVYAQAAALEAITTNSPGGREREKKGRKENGERGGEGGDLRVNSAKGNAFLLLLLFLHSIRASLPSFFRAVSCWLSGNGTGQPGRERGREGGIRGRSGIRQVRCKSTPSNGLGREGDGSKRRHVSTYRSAISERKCRDHPPVPRL